MVSNELMAPEQAQQMVQTNQAIMHATAAITGLCTGLGGQRILNERVIGSFAFVSGTVFLIFSFFGS